MKPKNDLSAKYVRMLLDYDSESGILYRKHTKNVAGCPNKRGYILVRIKDRLYYAHRLIWLIQTGEWPEHQVDHRDLDKGNNRWENLRDATPSQQKWNQPKNKNNTSGIKGVSFCEFYQKWKAVIGYKGKTITIGYFFTAEDAIIARARRAQELHGEFARAA